MDTGGALFKLKKRIKSSFFCMNGDTFFDIDYDFSAVSGQIMEKMDNEFSFLVAIKNKVLKITEYSINGLDTKNSYKVICSSMRNRLT